MEMKYLSLLHFLSRPRLQIVGALCVFAGSALYGQLVDQRITLTPGWNAVYISVAPQAGADELFKNWPVQSVSAYRSSETVGTEQLPGGLTGEYTANLPFGVWTREVPVASTLPQIPADTILVCFNTNQAPYEVVLRGQPMAPRITWRPSPPDKVIYNYVGVRLAGEVTAADYFAGAKIIHPVLKLGGMQEAHPIAFNPQRGATPWKLTDGTVVLVRTEKVSDWSGPLHVFPQDGVHFGTDEDTAQVEIRNDGTEPKTVQFDFVRSKGEMLIPTLQWKDLSNLFSTNRWVQLEPPLVKTLQTGEVWRVGLAVDRRQFPSSVQGERFGGVLKITETGGTHMKVDLPCSVDVAKIPDGFKQPPGRWPVGLWEGYAELNQVSRWSNGKSSDGLPAGGRMRIRLLIHVDEDGDAYLLQRVTVGAVKDEDGIPQQALFGPRAQIPTDFGSLTRISCAALPIGLGILPSRAGSFLGGPNSELVFSYRIGENDPSNPFHHTLHPHFDGLKADFKTPAPSGEDFENYIGAVKPERFPIGGEIGLAFDQTQDTPWEPVETATGRVRWIYTGVRREGPLRADGTFKISRISRIGRITK